MIAIDLDFTPCQEASSGLYFGDSFVLTPRETKGRIGMRCNAAGGGSPLSLQFNAIDPFAEGEEAPVKAGDEIESKT